MARKRNTTSISARYGKSEDRYLELIRRFPLRRLESESDLDAAIAVIDGLIDREHRTPPEEDYLEVISELIEDYEAENIVIGPVSDARMLRFLLDARDVTQSQTALDTGISESTISEILAGKRKLNRSQIGKLARYFHVEPGVFNFGE